jgi:hypothetical protein
MISGTLITESLRLNESLGRVPLTVTKITRLGPFGDTSIGQPSVWTFVEFTTLDDLAVDLAESLADAIDPVLGWYCDFRTDDDTFVVFSEKVFRYKRGHPEGRGEAAAYARLVGVPESQIDWPE